MYCTLTVISLHFILVLPTDETVDPYEGIEPINPGDMITYYSQLGVAGRKSDRYTATVVSVDPGRSPLLVLDNGQVLLPEQDVWRTKVMVNGVLKDHTSVKRRIKDFILEKNVPENTGVREGYRKEIDRVGGIVQNGLENLRAVAQADGYAPTDMLYSYNRGAVSLPT